MSKNDKLWDTIGAIVLIVAVGLLGLLLMRFVFHLLPPLIQLILLLIMPVWLIYTVFDDREKDQERERVELEKRRIAEAAESKRRQLLYEAQERDRRRQAWKEDAIWVMNQVENEYRRRGL